MNLLGRRVAALLVLSLLTLAGFGIAEAGVNPFWRGLGGSETGGGISMLGGNVSADSARLAFGSDSLPVVVYGTGPTGVAGTAQAITVRRWTGTAWQDISPTPAVFGVEPRIAIATNGTRFVSWLQDDGSGLQVQMLQRAASGSAWTALGNSSAVASVAGGVFSHALAVGANGTPVVAIDTLAQTGVFPLDEGVLQGTHQIYVLRFNGTSWEFLGGDPSTGGASNAVSIFVNGATFATHEASAPTLTVVNNRPTVAFKYTTDLGNASAPTEFIPGNTEIFVTQFVTTVNGSSWVALGPAVPQSDDGGAARGGLGGASHLDGDSATPSIASRDGASPLIWLAWNESGAATTAGIYARIFNGSDWVPGAGSGSDLVSDPLFTNSNPTVSIGPDSRAVVAWSAFNGTTEQIFVRRSGPAGFEEMGTDSAGGPGISDSPFFAMQPSVASPNSGGPAVAWLTNPAGDDGFQVYLRQFSTTGAFRLLVNRTGAGANTGSVTSSPAGIDCPSDTCSEFFASGQTVLLTAVAGSHAKFGSWTGCNSVNGSVCSVGMTSNRTVTANFLAASTVTLVKNGNGSLLVTSTPAGINCGPTTTDCSELFTAGTVVTLNAMVPVGTVFGGWGDFCAFRSKNLSCPLGTITGTNTSDRLVSVLSTLQVFTIKANVSAPSGTMGQGTVVDTLGAINCGFGTPNFCSEQEEFGSPVIFQATPALGSRFLNYTGTICNGRTNATCDFKVASNQSILALFRQVTDLSVNRTGNGAGRSGNRVTFAGNGFAGSSIDCGVSATGQILNDCTGQAFTNQSVVFTATLATGSNLDPDGNACTWTGAGATRTCSFVASGLGQSIDANFVQQKRHLHVNGQINGIPVAGVSVFTTSNPAGIDCGNGGFGHDDCDEDFDFGTKVALTPFDDDHTIFNRWTGCSSLNGSTCFVDMTANVTVTKFFDYSNLVDIIAINNGSGTISTNLAGPNSCVANGSGCSLTREVITGAIGSGGTKVVVTPKANTGSTFRWLSSDFGCTAGTANPCTANMSTGNHSAVGAFILNRHSVSVLRRANGSVTGVFPPGTFDCGSGGASTDCTETFDFGTQVHLLATPDDGFIFDRWSGVTCQGGQTNSSCGFKVQGNLSIIPFFRAHTFVSVGKTGNGKGTLAATIAAGGTLKPTAPTCGESCSALNFEAFDGRLVTLRATASTGTRFDGFSGECVSNTSTCTYLPSGNNDSIVATFTLRQFVVNVFNNPNGSVSNVNSLVDPIDCGGGLGSDCSSTLDFNTLVVLQASSLDGFTFTNWTTTGVNCNNVANSSNSSCSFRVPNGNVSLRANFRLATLVSIGGGGNGTGTVNSNPAGIACNLSAPTTATCTETFFDGKPVTLTAAAATGSRFDGFGVTCSSSSPTSCTFTPSGSIQNISATFTLRQFLVGVFNNPNGSVTNFNPLVDPIDCGGGLGHTDCTSTLDFNTLVVLKAAPLDGFIFTNWTSALCNGVTNSGNSTCSFRVPASNVSIAPNYRRATLVNVFKIGNGTGTVTSTPAGIACNLSSPTTATCSETFFDGKQVTLAPVAATGSQFGGFAGLTCLSNTSANCPFIPSGSVQNVSATFTKQAATVNLKVTGDGFVTRGVDVCDTGETCPFVGLFGDSITFLANPNAGNRFVSFTGCTTSNSSACTVVFAGTKNVSATFSFFIAVSKGGDGTGTVTPSLAGTSCGAGCSNYTPNTLVTLTEAPTGGSAFGGWGGDCTFRGFNTSCPLTVNENKVVTADFFRPVTLVVSKLGGGNGSVTSSPAGINCGTDCSNPYAFNTLVTLTAAAASGSVFGGFTGCDTLVGNFSCRVRMDGNRTVFATFNPPAPPLVSLNVTVSGNGSVAGPGISCVTASSGDCFETFAPGTQVTLVATADSGFSLDACSTRSTLCPGDVLLRGHQLSPSAARSR